MNVSVECVDQQFADRLRSAITAMGDQPVSAAVEGQLVVQAHFNLPEQTVVIRRGGLVLTLRTGLPISRHLDPTVLVAVSGLAPEVSIKVIMPDPAPTGLSKVVYLAKLGVRMVGMFRGYKDEVALLERTELVERIAPTALGGMTDAQLGVRASSRR